MRPWQQQANPPNFSNHRIIHSVMRIIKKPTKIKAAGKPSIARMTSPGDWSGSGTVPLTKEEQNT